MNAPVLDVIVIGAGHAGLSISYYLKKFHINHLVFEKGRIGDTWRNQRWDSFKLNTPNKVNLLPGPENVFSDDEGFCSSMEYVSFLESYSRKFHLPVVENSRVLSVKAISDLPDFSVYVSENGSLSYYRSKQIVVASGAQNIKLIQSYSKNVSNEIFQLHTSEYKNASVLPEGSVLVIGSAQSGIQVAEDLIGKGRKVYISTSQVPRVPRRYRGKDIVEWMILNGFFDLQTADVTDPQIFNMKQPQVSNAGLRGRTISLQSLARNGAVILGKTENIDGYNVFLQPNAAMHVQFADESSKKMKDMIDDYISKSNLYAPPPEEDFDDVPDVNASCASNVISLNLIENNITSVIWATAVTGDFSYLMLPVFDDSGILKHQNGISVIDGLYLIGLPWLRKRKSGIILGIREDAEFIADKILAHG